MSIQSSLFVGYVSPEVTARLRTLITNMKAGTQGTSNIGSEAYFGLRDGARKTMVYMRIQENLSRENLGTWLESQLNGQLAAQGKAEAVAATVISASRTKRASSFTFRTLTKDRLAAARRLVRDMKAGISGTSTISTEGRLTFGLTDLAVRRMIRMRNGTKTRQQVGAWLGVQLTKAVRDQEAAAHVPGKGRRRVQFA